VADRHKRPTEAGTANPGDNKKPLEIEVNPIEGKDRGRV
jgi:hypothetical protein